MTARLILPAGPPWDGQAMSRYLRSGELHHDGLYGAIRRLQRLHGAWLAVYPLGTGGPGLRITAEMRLLTETYLPMAAVRTAFRQLYRAALAFTPLLAACPVHRADSWLDLLPLFAPFLGGSTSPALLLDRAASDDPFRRRLLFAMFLPSHYGCGFNRYPQQLAQIGVWLRSQRSTAPDRRLRCLDAATGTGEGAYDLVQQLLETGYGPDRFTVHGSSADPFELLAGSGALFPHDEERGRRYRTEAARIAGDGAAARITFLQGDVREMPGDGGRYDLIVCNGLLGGPFLHAEPQLQRAIERLTGSLSRGGMLCCADRFHHGWRVGGTALTAALLRRAGCETGEQANGLVAYAPVRN